MREHIFAEQSFGINFDKNRLEIFHLVFEPKEKQHKKFPKKP